jgi:hypothetical protein
LSINVSGIDVRRTGTALIFESLVTDMKTGDPLVYGQVYLYIYRRENDGNLSWYDFTDNTFKSSGTTPTPGSNYQFMTHRYSGGEETGYWSFALATLTAFEVGRAYYSWTRHINSGEDEWQPPQMRMFQYGGVDGDAATSADIAALPLAVQNVADTAPAPNTVGAAAVAGAVAALAAKTEVEKVPRAEGPVVGGAAVKHTRTGGTDPNEDIATVTLP